MDRNYKLPANCGHVVFSKNQGAECPSGSFPDIHERPLSATSGSSWIGRQWSDDVSLNDRYRLGAAGQIIELRQAENDPLPPDAVRTDECLFSFTTDIPDGVAKAKFN